jgi:hypothetical protein
MASTSFFLPRSPPSAMPLVTRTAQPGTPRPLSVAVAKPASTPSAIVLAWDNVLFPTKWMAECVGLVSSNKNTLEHTKRACLNNPFIVQALAAIELQLLALLAVATTKAPVFILSDHCTSTVDAVCSAFFPRLKASLVNANGRVYVMGATSTTGTTLTSSDRAAWKQSMLEQICRVSMERQGARSAVHGVAPFKVLAVSADELDLRVAARVQSMVARVGIVQTLALPVAMENGKPLALVDFHKQLQAVSSALAM